MPLGAISDIYMIYSRRVSCGYSHLDSIETYHNGRNQTDTETSDDTTTNEKTDGGGGDLESNANGEDATSDDDGQPTSDPVRKTASEECTEERAGR
jgi:hypothetical protein